MAKINYATFDASNISRKDLLKIYYNMAAALNMRTRRSKGDIFEEITDSFQNIEYFKSRHRKLVTKSGAIKRSVPKSLTLTELRTLTEEMATMLTEKAPKTQAKNLEKSNQILTSQQKSYIRKHHPELANKIVKRITNTNDDYFDKDGSPDIQKPGGEEIVEKYYDENITMEDVDNAINNINTTLTQKDTSFERMHVDSVTGKIYYTQDDGSKYYPN